MKWNESGFQPPLCTYRLNWARRTSWGWWDEWDDTVLQTQDLKFDPWRSEVEHATSRWRRLPKILSYTRGWGRNIFVSFKPPRPRTEPRTLAWKAAILTTNLGAPPINRNEHQSNWVKTDIFLKWKNGEFYVYAYIYSSVNRYESIFGFLQQTSSMSIGCGVGPVSRSLHPAADHYLITSPSGRRYTINLTGPQGVATRMRLCDCLVRRSNREWGGAGFGG